MLIFAADLSLTSTGWAIGKDGALTKSGLILGIGNGAARLIQMRNAVCSEIDRAGPDLIVFEELAFSKNQAYAKENAGLAWMIRAELFTDRRPYLLVAASQLKKYCVGSGGSKKQKVGKELILKCVFQRWGHDVSSNDEADAIVLCHLGMALAGDEQPTIAPQQEVLAAIRKKEPWLKEVCLPVDKEAW